MNWEDRATLGYLIDHFADKSPDDYTHVRTDLGEMYVERLCSWRGDCNDLAIVLTTKEKDGITTMGGVHDMLACADGNAFEGYKGGSYTMSRDTLVHLVTTSSTSGETLAVPHGSHIYAIQCGERCDWWWIKEELIASARSKLTPAEWSAVMEGER